MFVCREASPTVLLLVNVHNIELNPQVNMTLGCHFTFWKTLQNIPNHAQKLSNMPELLSFYFMTILGERGKLNSSHIEMGTRALRKKLW